MDRSFSRFATLLGSATAIGLLLAGCSSGAPGGAVIGVPKSSTSAPAQPSANILAGFEQAITNELNAIDSTQSANEAPEALIELEALDNPSSFERAENFQSLLAIGANQATKRERVIEALMSEVSGNAYLHGVSVGGRSLAASLLAILEGVNSQLGALSDTIAGATLADAARADVVSINASTRVYGLIEPMVHLGLAGGDELAEASALASQAQSLATQVAASTGNINYPAMVTTLHDLSAQIASARAIVGSSLSPVLSLTASGFPGNKGTLAAARVRLSQVRAPSGPLQTAATDVNHLQTLLASA